MPDLSESLDIDVEDFKRMKPKDQMVVLFKNQRATLKDVRGYRFHQKVQYILASIFTLALGWVGSVLIELLRRGGK